jgi:hypothetical protein
MRKQTPGFSSSARAPHPFSLDEERYRRARSLAGEPNSTEETFMARSGMFSSNKSILILVACICFAIAVLTTAGVLSLGKISWTDLGLFFGFLSFLF